MKRYLFSVRHKSFGVSCYSVMAKDREQALRRAKHAVVSNKLPYRSTWYDIDSVHVVHS